MSTACSDLKAWQKAMELVVGVYRCTRSFPKEETYGLTSQMRRAAVSVPSNIAEGRGRFSNKELVHFLSNARGSLLELETQIIISQELGYLNQEQSNQLTEMTSETGRILNGLMNTFRASA